MRHPTYSSEFFKTKFSRIYMNIWWIYNRTSISLFTSDNGEREETPSIHPDRNSPTNHITIMSKKYVSAFTLAENSFIRTKPHEKIMLISVFKNKCFITWCENMFKLAPEKCYPPVFGSRPVVRSLASLKLKSSQSLLDPLERC